MLVIHTETVSTVVFTETLNRLPLPDDSPYACDATLGPYAPLLGRTLAGPWLPVGPGVTGHRYMV